MTTREKSAGEKGAATMDDFSRWLGEQKVDPGFRREYDSLRAEYERASGEERTVADEAEGESLSLEEAFSSLDAMLDRLEDRELPLEEALRLYQQGMKLLSSCNEKIDMAEKKILVVNEEGTLDEFR